MATANITTRNKRERHMTVTDTDKLLSIKQLARKLGVHRVTAEMVVDSHTIARCTEDALADFRRTRKPVTRAQSQEITDRALTNLETTLGAFLDVDLNRAESTVLPEMQQVSDCFRSHIQRVITELQSLLEESRQVVMECRSQIDQYLVS